MHAMGLHSALAIKRQRRRREEQKRARERRFSSQSTESGLGESRSSCGSPRNSLGSLDRRKQTRYRRPRKTNNDQVVSSVGMLHIGVIFIVLGLFLIGSGLIPDDVESMKKASSYFQFNELVISGLASLIVGIFLCILNKVITKKEEKDLAEYVSRQLTRSKSGHRLVRDVETGNLSSTGKTVKTTKEEKMNILESEINDLSPGCSPIVRSPPPLTASTPRSDLERILEEELSEQPLSKRTQEEVHQPADLITARYYNTLDMNEK